MHRHERDRAQRAGQEFAESLRPYVAEGAPRALEVFDRDMGAGEWWHAIIGLLGDPDITNVRFPGAALDRIETDVLPQFGNRADEQEDRERCQHVIDTLRTNTSPEVST